MAAAGLAVDTQTLISELGRTGTLEAVNGVAYVLDLTYMLPRTLNPSSYIAILRRQMLARKVVALCETAREEAEAGADPEDLLERIAATTRDAQREVTTVRPKPIAEFIVPTLQELARQRETPRGECLGVPSGLAQLDRCTTGWREGELSYVGALPGGGKTSFLLQAMYAAATAGIGVGCISLEMRATQLVRRLALMHSKLSAHKLRDSRTMTPAEYEHAKRSLYAMGDLDITITDQSGLRPSQIASQARQMYEMGARLIVVVFVQIIHEDGKERREAINRVSASLRDTCKALNVPFLVASQLARRDANPNRRPTLQDLRESGNLEQDAHNVILLHRPKDETTGDWTGMDEAIIDKQREGVTGMVPVSYNDELLMFEGRSA